MPHRALALTHKLGTKWKGRDLGQTSGPKKRKVSGSTSKAKGKLQAVESDSQDNFGDEDKPAFVLSDQDDLEDVSILSNDNAPTVPSQKILDKNMPNDIYESSDENFSNEDDDSTNNYQWSLSFLEESCASFKPYYCTNTTNSLRHVMCDHSKG